MPREHLTTITDAAAEFGINRVTFVRRLAKRGIRATRRVPHSPMGKGFTPGEMKMLRKIFAPAEVGARP